MTTLAEKVQESQFASLADWQVADSLNTPSAAYPKRIDISTAEVTNYLARIQKINKLRELRSATDSRTITLGGNQVTLTADQLKELGEGIEMILIGRWSIIECSKPEVDAAFLTQLSLVVALGIIDQSQAAIISGMADSIQSWAQANNQVVTHIEVAKARRG